MIIYRKYGEIELRGNVNIFFHPQPIHSTQVNIIETIFSTPTHFAIHLIARTRNNFVVELSRRYCLADHRLWLTFFPWSFVRRW